MPSPAVAGVRSLGFRTDLALLELEGASVTPAAGCLVIRTPANPTYHWGNFLLLRRPPGRGELGDWVDRFGAEFPGADYVALGVDGPDGAGRPDGSGGPDGAGIPSDELARAGLVAGRETVLTAAAVRSPPRPNRAAEYRALSTDRDWRAQLDLQLAIDGSPSADNRLFLQRRVADHRRLVQAGYGRWLGAFLDGRLCSSLGVFTAAPGVARYQNVGTHPDARGRGLAGNLLYEAGRYALTALGATTLVIVADPDYHAIGIYRSVGFADTETQLGLEGAARDG